MDDDEKSLWVIHDVERGGNLDLLLRGYLGLGNRVVDALLAIALSIAHSNAPDPSVIASLTERLKKSTDALKAAEDLQKETT